MPIINLGDEIPAGMDYVGAELSAGRTGLWIGRGPAGFALILGGQRMQDVGSGKVLAASLTPSALRKIRGRIDELLGEQGEGAVNVKLPDGLALGETPRGDQS